MNQRDRESLELYLRKAFPDNKIFVTLSDNGEDFEIVGDGVFEKRHEIWRKFDEYTLKHWGWKTDWREPLHF